MKFYAVAKGVQPGIYTSWSECEKQVKNFKGSLYRSFTNKEEAQTYLNQMIEAERKANAVVEGKGWEVYVDGSYSPEVENYAAGAVILKDGHIVEEICLLGQNPALAKEMGQSKDFSSARNVAGECLGMVQALKYVLEQNEEKAVVAYYDYLGLSAWLDGSWKVESDTAIEYSRQMESLLKELDVTFVKVEAHTGVKYNERADQLAKEALGIILK